MPNRALPLLAAALLAALPLHGQETPRRTLDIYFIDTEGGQSTLYLTPSGESVLVDTGNPGGRDSERILRTLSEAGVRQIDHLIVTHYHGDHVGGLQEIAARIPVAHFIDHGEPADRTEQAAAGFRAYSALHAGKRHTVVRPGDRLPVAGLDWRIVSSAAQTIRTALPGAGQPNAACQGWEPQDSPRDLENPQSVGSVISFGRFRTVNLGDMLFGGERALVCPANLLGTVDLYLTSHHGVATSGAPALLSALRPRVAVMNNGTRKGGSVAALTALHAAPGLEDLWQLHWSHHGGTELNAPGLFIANPDEPASVAAVVTGPAPSGPTPPHDGPAYLIRVSASQDGSFAVTNTRNGFTRHYAARP